MDVKTVARQTFFKFKISPDALLQGLRALKKLTPREILCCNTVNRNTLLQCPTDENEPTQIVLNKFLQCTKNFK